MESRLLKSEKKAMELTKAVQQLEEQLALANEKKTKLLAENEQFKVLNLELNLELHAEKEQSVKCNQLHLLVSAIKIQKALELQQNSFKKIMAEKDNKLRLTLAQIEMMKARFEICKTNCLDWRKTAFRMKGVLRKNTTSIISKLKAISNAEHGTVESPQAIAIDAIQKLEVWMVKSFPDQKK